MSGASAAAASAGYDLVNHRPGSALGLLQGNFQTDLVFEMPSNFEKATLEISASLFLLNSALILSLVLQPRLW